MTRNWHDICLFKSFRLRWMRHLLFWLTWLFYFSSSFFYEQQGMPAAGSGKWIFIILFKSCFLLLCHMFIVYAIIYFLMPRFALRNPPFISPRFTDHDFDHYRMGLFLLCHPLS